MTPEQEEQVRRALAALGDGHPEAARSDTAETMPPEVVARLDGVLADLRTPGSDGTDRTDGVAVDDLSRRRARRGRWQKAGLAAAAACVAALVGTAVSTGGLGLGGSSSTTASSDSGGTSAAERLAGAPESAPSARRPSSAPGATSGDGSARRVTAGPRVRLRTATLATDVQALVDSGSLRPVAPREPPPSCDVPPLRRGDRLLAVRLDGRPASLVLGPPDATSRTAQVFGCRDTAAALASVVVRTRGR